MQLRTILLAAALSGVPGLLHAQFDFKVADRTVQVHSFASQGFLYSNNNNYLTMKTSDGSAAFTDFGFNATMQVSDKFRIGAQMYDRNVGRMGNWRPTLDWAFGDYRFRDWFGIRAGKVKTALGLYNDTQDMESLHTWAIMPQSTYAIDVRGDFIAHVGADAYGNIPIKKLGALSYTIWGGLRQDDPQGGYRLGLLDFPTGRIVLQKFSGTAEGADLRWSTPLPGLMVGSSVVAQDYVVDGIDTLKSNGLTLDLHLPTKKHHTNAHYVQYTKGKLRLDGEYRKTWRVSQSYFSGAQTFTRQTSADWHYGYVSAAYRLNNRIEVGTYHSRFYPAWGALHSPPAGHVFDQALTVRFDLKEYLSLKVEGHFMDGYGDGSNFRGFYPSDNPQGLQPKMNMLVVRLGYRF